MKATLAAHHYTRWAGVFLLLQGTTTLAFRLFPPLDRAFPPLLELTRMQPPHSFLHIATGLVALSVLQLGPPVAARFFAALFGALYTGLALYGLSFHHATCFELQPFDHPFHLLLGLLGLACAAISSPATARKTS